jgi:hypothetical protein
MIEHELAAGQGANRFNWHDEIAPEADVAMPDGHALIRMANSGTTSTGNVVPDQVLALPADEAARLVRDGLAHPVRAVPGAGSPTARYVNPMEVFRASLPGTQHDDAQKTRA